MPTNEKAHLSSVPEDTVYHFDYKETSHTFAIIGDSIFAYKITWSVEKEIYITDNYEFKGVKRK